MKIGLFRTTCILLAASTLTVSPTAFSQTPPNLVPGSTFHYLSVSEEIDDFSFFLLFLGSVGPWNLYLNRSDAGDTVYYAETAYGLDYVICDDDLITPPEDLAVDIAALSSLSIGDSFERTNGAETVFQLGPTSYSSEYFPDRTFEARQIKITNIEEDEPYDTLFTYTTDGEVGLEIDWGEGNKDVLTSFNIAATPAPPLSRQRVMELCPVLIDYYPDD